MLVKCGMVVLAIGATACGLLTLRQSRLQAASELAQAQLRIGTSDEKLWALRSQIAERVTPGNVERMAASVGPLKPISAPPMRRPSPGDAMPTLAYVEGVPGAPRKVLIVSSTASDERELMREASPVPPVTNAAGAEVLKASISAKAPGKTPTQADARANAKAAAKLPATPTARPAGKQTKKKASPPKEPPPETMIRADAGGKKGPIRVAIVEKGRTNPPSSTQSKSGGGAKRAGKAGTGSTVAAGSRMQNAGEPKTTQIAMQPERR